MLITVQVARVYASNSVYGSEVRADPANAPIVIEDYPHGWARSRLLLGTPPMSLIEARRTRQALGIVEMELLRGQHLSLAEALQQATYPQIEQFASFTTFIVEREAEVPDSAIVDAGPMWLVREVARELEDRYSAEASPHIDRLVAYLATVIDLPLFEEVIYADNVFFTASDRDVFAGLPRSSARARLIDHRPLETLNLSLLRNLPQDIPTLSEEKLELLDAVKHWLAAALHEQDQWKGFLWSFLVLEVLSNKLFGKVYPSVEWQADQGAVPQPVANAIQESKDAKARKSDTNLRSKFTIVAYYLSPADCDDDIEAFAGAVIARNDLSHGRSRDASTLPRTAVRALITKYLTKVIQSALL